MSITKSSVNIIQLISSKDWPQLRSYVLQQTQSVLKVRTFESALHYACKFHPPLYIVKCLYQAYPEAIFEQDEKERYVLHIACKHGCPPRIIEFLLQRNRAAAKKPDIKYLTPAHLACKSYVQKSGKGWDSANRNLFEVMGLLFDAAPLSSTREDIKGMIALNYAVDRKLSSVVIKYIQLVCDESKKELLDQSVDLAYDHGEKSKSITNAKEKFLSSSIRRRMFIGLHSFRATAA